MDKESKETQLWMCVFYWYTWYHPISCNTDNTGKQAKYRVKKGNRSSSPRRPPSRNIKATLKLYLHPSLPIPILLFSSVDHGRLISICFTVISHNGSIAAAVPAYHLPRCQPLLPASRLRLAALACKHTHQFSGVFRQLHPECTHQCCPSCSAARHFLCWFLHISFPFKCTLQWCIELHLHMTGRSDEEAFEHANDTSVNLTKAKCNQDKKSYFGLMNTTVLVLFYI